MPKKRRTSRQHSSVAAVAGRGSAGKRSSTSTTRIRKIKRYGWIPDIPDQRDYLYAAPPAFLRALPPRVDLRKQCPPVYDQGQLGSCTANAIGGAIEFDQMKEKLPQIFIPSRLFIYYNERVIEGTVNTDAGAMLRDGIKTVAKQGACPEPMWPYLIARFKTRPSAACYAEGAKQYRRELSTVGSIAVTNAGLPGFRLSFRLWLYCLRKLRNRRGRAHRPRPDACLR